MRRIITQLSKKYSDVNDRKLTKYLAMRSHEGWAVHQEMLLLLRGMIAEELLSRRFTEKDKDSKDVEQRAYMMVDELIRFLINPLEKAIKRAQFARAFDERMGKKTARQ